MTRRHFITARSSPHLIRRRPAFEPLESRCLLAAIAMLDEEQLVIELINRARESGGGSDPAGNRSERRPAAGNAFHESQTAAGTTSDLGRCRGRA